jgi:hypothetical protein
LKLFGCLAVWLSGCLVVWFAGRVWTGATFTLPNVNVRPGSLKSSLLALDPLFSRSRQVLDLFSNFSFLGILNFSSFLSLSCRCLVCLFPLLPSQFVSPP